MEDPASFFVPPCSAYTAQTLHLFSASLKENILLGVPEEAVDLPGALYLSVLEPDLALLEQGPETPIRARGQTFWRAGAAHRGGTHAGARPGMSGL